MLSCQTLKWSIFRNSSKSSNISEAVISFALSSFISAAILDHNLNLDSFTFAWLANRNEICLVE